MTLRRLFNTPSMCISVHVHIFPIPKFYIGNNHAYIICQIKATVVYRCSKVTNRLREIKSGLQTKTEVIKIGTFFQQNWTNIFSDNNDVFSRTDYIILFSKLL